MQKTGQSNKVQTLINSNSEVNEIFLAYTAKIDFTTHKTNIGVQKIEGLVLETYSMALACFLLFNSLGRVRFIEKTLILVNSHVEIILGMLFLPLSNVNVEFSKISGKLT